MQYRQMGEDKVCSLAEVKDKIGIQHSGRNGSRRHICKAIGLAKLMQCWIVGPTVVEEEETWPIGQCTCEWRCDIQIKDHQVGHSKLREIHLGSVAIMPADIRLEGIPWHVEHPLPWTAKCKKMICKRLQALDVFCIWNEKLGTGGAVSYTALGHK